MESARRSKIASEKTKEGQDKKKSEDLGRGKISSINSVKKRILISKVKNKEGETIKTRQGIANVFFFFVKFFEDLYEGEEGYTEKGMASRTENDDKDHDQRNSIPEFTKHEIQDAIDRLKKGKAKDSNGTRAEQLKNCSDDTKENHDDLQRNCAAR